MIKFFTSCFFVCLLLACSSREEDEIEKSIFLPKTLITKLSSGNSTVEYQYEGTKLKGIFSSSGSKSLISYSDNLITKSVRYNSAGAVEFEVDYEYKNRKLSKTILKTGILTTATLYTWVNDNHVFFEDDSYKPDQAINRTDVYFDKGNVTKSTNHIYYPNQYTIDKVEIIENDIKNNPFKNIEGYALLSFDTSSDFFPQANNIKKITTTRTGSVNGEPFTESYIKSFQHSFNVNNFPLSYITNDSFGNSTSYEFSYFEQ